MQTSARVSTLVALAVVVLFATGGWAQATEKIIYSFTGGTDGGLPQGGLVSDGKGNLFGTTSSGGANGAGTVFELSPASNGAWTEQVLHSFSWSDGDGAFPYAGLVFDSKGNLYSTTALGGPNFNGTVFELIPGSNGTWTEQILYSFGGGNNGTSPYGGVVLDTAGNIYGFAEGGANGWGIVYQLVPGSNGTWTENILHAFANENDGSVTFANSPMLDRAGNVYGVAYGGPHDYGLVFKLTHGSNGTWTEKTVYASVGGSLGGSFFGFLTFDNVGNLYGGTEYSVLELMPGPNESWTLKTLYSFKGSPDGAFAEAPLVFDKAGNLYSTTFSGGIHRGTVFKLLPGSNGAWAEKILHSFGSTSGDGISPARGSLVLDASGNLYGTTSQGGTWNNGVVFEVTP